MGPKAAADAAVEMAAAEQAKKENPAAEGIKKTADAGAASQAKQKEQTTADAEATKKADADAALKQKAAMLELTADAEVVKQRTEAEAKPRPCLADRLAAKQKAAAEAEAEARPKAGTEADAAKPKAAAEVLHFVCLCAIMQIMFQVICHSVDCVTGCGTCALNCRRTRRNPSPNRKTRSQNGPRVRARSPSNSTNQRLSRQLQRLLQAQQAHRPCK